MTHLKSLEEFIEKIVVNIMLENIVDLRIAKEIGNLTAAEILRVCEEWNGMDAYEHGYDKPTDEHSCDNCRGRQCSAGELYDFLKFYINSKPANTEGGDGE